MKSLETRPGYSSSRVRLQELRAIRNRGKVSDEKIAMNLVYGIMSSSIILFVAFYLIHYVYKTVYPYNPSRFRLTAIFVVVATAAWFYYRIPRILNNYRLWKDRKESQSL